MSDATAGDDDAPEPRPDDEVVDPRPPDTTSLVEARLAWVAALAAVVLAALFIPGPHDFPLDDAWIHLSYAKSVRLGDGLAYNPGDSELGFSSPLWVGLLAVWPIEGNPVRAVQLLGVLLHGLTAWIAAHLGLRLARQRASTDEPLPLSSLTVLAGVLVAASPGLVRSATSGMEVSLAAALCLGSAWTMMFARPGWAMVVGALAVWARPECLGFVVALAAVLAPWRYATGTRGAAVRAPLASALGGVGALSLWLLYCWVVAGQWWPNGQLVKGEGGGLEGLGYVVERVLPWQPWLISLTGVVLLVLALRRDLASRRPELLALVLAGLGTAVAIAISRPLNPAVLFFESRYFTPFVGVLAVALPFGLPRARPWLALVLMLPLAVVSGLQIDALHERDQSQRADIHQIHGALADHVVEHLPPDARIAVEGAGAPRFFAPRTTTIVDLVGLNDHEMARRRDDVRAKMCHLVRRRPTHFAIPLDWVEDFAPVFAMTAIARFDDPVFTQVDPPRAPHVVVLLAVDEIHPAWVEGCAKEP